MTDRARTKPRKRRRVRRLSDADLHVIAAAYCGLPAATFDAIVSEESSVEIAGRIAPWTLRNKLNFLLRVAACDSEH
jgi:hypothetical protein